jgi:hypothetical protein
VTLSEEYWLSVFKNVVLRRIFGTAGGSNRIVEKT